MIGWTRAILYARSMCSWMPLELRDLGFDGIDPAATGRPGVSSFADAQTPLRLTPHIAAQSFKKLAKGCEGPLRRFAAVPLFQAIAQFEAAEKRQVFGATTTVTAPYMAGFAVALLNKINPTKAPHTTPRSFEDGCLYPLKAENRGSIPLGSVNDFKYSDGF